MTTLASISAAELAVMGAGPEIRTLAAEGMGWHWVVDSGNCEGGYWKDQNGICASFTSDWWPDTSWRDTGRILDAAAARGWAPELCYDVQMSRWQLRLEVGRGFYGMADTAQLAVARAFCLACKAAGEEEE